MANTVLITTLSDGARNAKFHVLIQGDGSGDESGLPIAEALALTQVPERLKLVRVHGRFEGFKGTLQWGSDIGNFQPLIELPDDDDFDFNYGNDGPCDPRSTGFNGDIVLDTDGLAEDDEGHFYLHVVKKGRENISG